MSWSFRTNGNFIDFVHTDETSLAVENIIISLHNTSKCIDWSLPEDTTRISFTIDEIKYSNIPITDIDFDGTAMDSQDDFETGIEAMFPGLAGGGAASYLVATVTLTDDQIKALPNYAPDGGIEIVPPPGVNKVIIPIYGFAILDATAGAYTGSAATWRIMYKFEDPQDFEYFYVSSALVATTIIADSSKIGIAMFQFPNSIIGGGTWAGLNTTGEIGCGLINGISINGGLWLKDDLNGTDYTGGNAANTLKVTIYYIVVDL